MKTSIVVAVSLFMFEASAKHVCYGRNEQCSAKRNIICGEVEELDASTYRISRLQHITGCLSWGVSRVKSKNGICKNMLAEYGETRKVKYLNDSEVRGEYETAFDHESIGQIDCEVKGVK